MRDEGDSEDNEITENSEQGDDVAESGKKIHDSNKKNKRSAKILGKRQNASGFGNEKNEQDLDPDGEDSNIIDVCGLMIDIEKITKQEILKMRKYLPKKDYR